MTSPHAIDDDLTPWFDGAVHPHRVGPYKRRFPAGPYSCWDGSHWFGDNATPAQASLSERLSRFQDAAWRGLAAPPEAEEICSTCRGHGVLDDGDEDHEDGLASVRPCPDC